MEANTPATPASVTPSQPASQPQTATTPEPAATTTQQTTVVKTPTPASKKSKTPLILGIVLVLILLGVGGYLVMKRNQAVSLAPTPSPLAQVEESPSPDVIPSESPETSPAASEAPAPAGALTYTNTVYGFSFDYSPQTPDPCEDNSCVKLPASGVSVNVDLSIPEGTTDMKQALMKSDLFCSADGPSGSISCKNTKVDDFVTDSGVKGYRVLRTSTVENQATGSVTNIADEAYYFALSKPVTNSYGAKFTGVILSATDHQPQQVVALDVLAKTFKLQ